MSTRRLVIIAVALALCGVAAMQGVSIRQYVPRFAPLDLVQLALGAVLAVLLARPASDPHRLAPLTAASTLWVSLLAVLSCGLFALLIADAALFSRLAHEDGPVEWASAIALLLAALVAGLMLFRQALAVRHSRGWLQLVAPALLVGFCIFVGMEEISWGQRLFGWQTPEWMAVHNQQNESNLHNFDTMIAEVVYHGMVVLLMLGLWLALPVGNRMRPGTAVLVAAMLAATLNHYLFNNVVVQFSILLALAVAARAALAAASVGRQRDASVLAIAFALLLVGQVLTLLMGDRFVRPVDNEEAKELLLALALAGWVVHVGLSAHNDSSPQRRLR